MLNLVSGAKSDNDGIGPTESKSSCINLVIDSIKVINPSQNFNVF